MKRVIIAVSLSLLSGCVDMGRVGLHPEMKTVYFDGHPWQSESCLTSAAWSHHFTLEQDDPLPGGTKRYNLQQQDETVAWVELTKSGHHQTSATFYYNPKAPDISAAISAMIAECRR